MKTASVRALKHSTSTVLDWVLQGETVQITRHNKVIGTLVPASSASATETPPDFYARLESLFLDQTKVMTGTEIVSFARGER